MSLLGTLKKREEEKEKARIFEERARDILEKQKKATKPRVEHRKIPGRIEVKDLSKYHSEASRLYKNAAELWSSGENYQRAIADYKLAYQYAWGEAERENLKKRVINLQKLGGRVERRAAFATVAIVSLIGALLSVSLNLTGYAVGALGYEDISLVGTALFILGLVFAFLFVKSKNKKV